MKIFCIKCFIFSFGRFTVAFKLGGASLPYHPYKVSNVSMKAAVNKRIAQWRNSQQVRTPVQPQFGMDKLATIFAPNHGYESACSAGAIREKLKM